MGSTIKLFYQKGNYFIMDSEQLVCNPFEELQKEALEPKRTSVTEKLTSVKNNICDNHLKFAENQLEKEKTEKLKDINTDSSNLRYDVKKLNIQKQKIGLEVKKRLEPERDFTYDETQVTNSEKRLGSQTESFYLQKKLKYPVREKFVDYSKAPPLISKARKSLKEQQQKDKKETERSNTALTTSTGVMSVASSRNGPVWQRRNSKSAPLSAESHPDTKQGHIPTPAESKLPAISQSRLKNPGRVSFSVLGGSVHQTKQVVPNRVTRSQTFYSGMNRRKSTAWEDSSDDDIGLPEKVDLRALFFGGKNGEMQRSATRQSYADAISLRKVAHNQVARPLTQEMLVEDSRQLRQKIDTFLGTLEKEEVVEEIQEEIKPPPKNEVVSKASTLLSIFSKPIDPVPYTFKVAEEEEERPVKSACSHRTKSAHSVKSAIPKRNLWEYIQTSVRKGNVRRLYTPQDLVLQEMTGLKVGGPNDKSKVPLHSANRALRHNPTYQMQKVLEQIMQNRTRYEQHEMEVLKVKMGSESGGDDTDIKASQTESQQTIQQQVLSV